jgi:MFS family permease
VSAGRPTFGSALRSAPFRHLVTSHAAGTVAQLVLTLAVGLEVLARTGSGPWTSVTVALGFAPYVLFSGVAGAVADRWSRSVVLAWSAGVRAAGAGLAAAGVAWSWPVPVLVTVTALAATAATPSYPALAAATPDLVPDAALPAANALVTGIENVAWIAGPGVFGVLLVAGLDTTAALAVCSALFALAWATAAAARLPRPTRRAHRGWGYESVEGLRVLRGEPGTRRPMALAMVDNFLYGYLVVALVLLAEEQGGADSVGRLNAALTLGALASLLVVNHLTDRPHPERVLGAMIFCFIGAVGTLALAGPTPLGLVLVAVAGAATLVAEVVAVTVLQRVTGDDVAARLFGVYDQLNVGAIVVGSLLAGPLARWWGGATAMVSVAAACLVLTAVLNPGPTRVRQPLLVR